MKSILTLLLSCSLLFLNAQTFKEQIAVADAHYDAKEYEQSVAAYTAAFAIEEGGRSEYYNAACSAALSGNKETALQYLDKAADKGWRNYDWMHKDGDLQTLREDEKWTAIAAKVQANKDEYEKDFDKPLKAQLEKIRVKDQMLRQLYRHAEEKFGRESEEMNYFWSLVNEQDSLNEIEVLTIIDERGWPGKSLVGENANMTVWLVIQHAPLETQEKYLPLLKASVAQGESRGSRLALLEDRIEMRNERPQIYGSQIRRNEETDEQEVYNLLDPEYVDQRRASVGLGPLADYVKRWDIEFTVPQKEK